MPVISTGALMAFVFFTRPDDSPVGISTAEVLRFSPVPPSKSPLGGPLDKGTRIEFRNGAHQDVKELVDEVAKLLNQALNPDGAATLFKKQIKSLNFE